MFGKSLLIVSILVLTSCAEPKYINGSTSGLGGSEKLSNDCSVQFQKSGFCITLKWEQLPTESKMGSFLFKVYRLNLADNSPVPIDQKILPQVQLWMPSMGHGSTPVKVDRMDIGTYRASNVFFIMPGEWDIKFQVKDGTTIQDEALIHITF